MSLFFSARKGRRLLRMLPAIYIVIPSLTVACVVSFGCLCFLFFWGGYTLSIELSLAVTGLYRIDAWLSDFFPLSWWSSEKNIGTSMISQVIQIYGQTNVQNQNAWSYNILWEIVTAELYAHYSFWLVNSSFPVEKGLEKQLSIRKLINEHKTRTAGVVWLKEWYHSASGKYLLSRLGGMWNLKMKQWINIAMKSIVWGQAGLVPSLTNYTYS